MTNTFIRTLGGIPLYCLSGRGIYPMRALMDEICFDEGGSVVHMRKTPNDSREVSSEHSISK